MALVNRSLALTKAATNFTDVQRTVGFTMKWSAIAAVHSVYPDGTVKPKEISRQEAAVARL